MVFEDMSQTKTIPLCVISIVMGLVIAAAMVVMPEAARAQSKANSEVQHESDRVLTIGRVSGNPRKHAGRLKTLGDFLVARHDSFDDVKVVLAHRSAGMVEAVARHEIDLISETIFTALQIESVGNMEMALLEWKDGVRNYHSAVLVMADSRFQQLEDLKGAKIAFEDPGSTSGFFLPYVEMVNAGLKLVPDQSKSVSPDSLRYVFGGAELNVVGSLIRGRVDAAVISNLDMNDDEVVTARFKPHLRVLHETQEVPRSVMMMRTSLPADIRDRLSAILLSMHETDEGRSVLRRYFRLKQFEEIDDISHARVARVRQNFDEYRKR